LRRGADLAQHGRSATNRGFFGVMRRSFLRTLGQSPQTIRRNAKAA
jgi:hypothetical protein